MARIVDRLGANSKAARSRGPARRQKEGDVDHLKIRSGLEGDLPALTEIYNYYVRETAITFDIEPFTTQTRRPWFSHFNGEGPYRLIVAEKEGDLLGYANSHPLRAKAAYITSVETSIYLAPEAGGHGIGTALYTALFDALRDEDVHRAYAGITLPNAASLALHRRFGFEPLGIYREVGRKFGRYWDVQWLEKAVND